MARIVQPKGTKGSLRWIQLGVNHRRDLLDGPILAMLPDRKSVIWKSPLSSDDYAEYRDGAFLERIGCSRLIGELEQFWPRQGPQWDALGITDRGDVLLVEAKAHIGELCSPGSAAGPKSRLRVEEALAQTALALAASPRAPWIDVFYQLANRLAYLEFLRRHGVMAWLVLVNFVGDMEVGGPSTRGEWEAAYAVVHHVMGLRGRHRLSRYVLHVYPEVAELSD
jgi:hypothetical protein